MLNTRRAVVHGILTGVSLLAALLLGVFDAQPALALGRLFSPFFTCTGSQTVLYDPGLTNVSRTVNADIIEEYDSCAGIGKTAGVGTFSVDETASCTSFNLAEDEIIYTWSDGQFSVVHFPATPVIRALSGTTEVTSVGTVTYGYGYGAIAIRIIAIPQLDIDACYSPAGVLAEEGTASLTLLRLF